LRVTSSFFYNNLAYISAGILYVTTESYFNLNGTIFSENEAGEISTIDVKKSSFAHNNTINECDFTYNKAVRNTISLMYSNTIITRCFFKENEAIFRSKNIFMGFSNVLITNTDFILAETNNINTLINYEDNSIGSFMFVITDVNLTIIDTNFINGYA